MSDNKPSSQERDATSARLYKLSVPQLGQLAEAINVRVKIAATKQELVTAIMVRGMGFPLVKLREPVAPTDTPVYTIEEVDFMIRTYAADEAAQLRATASMIETLLGLPRPTKQLADEVYKELSYYTGHSNLGRLANLRNALPPNRGQV